MKNILIIVLIGIFSSISIYGQNKSYNIHISQILEQKTKKTPELREALSSLKSFISAYSDSLFFEHNNISIDLKKHYHQLFFPPIADDRYSHFYIVSGEMISQDVAEFKIVSRTTVPDLDYDEILSINNIIINKNKVDIAYKQRLKNYDKIKVGNILYYTKDKHSFDCQTAEEATLFCDSIKQLFNIKELPELHYILAKNNKNPLEFLGFDYTWTPLACYIKPENLLLSGNVGENYRHELVHYILQEYELNNYISEGIAVFLGGSNNELYETTIKNTIVDYGIPSAQQIIEVLTDDKPTPDFFQYFYSLSAVCVDVIYSEKGFAGLQSLLKPDYQTLNMIQVMEKLLGKAESDIVNAITARLL